MTDKNSQALLEDLLKRFGGKGGLEQLSKLKELENVEGGEESAAKARQMMKDRITNPDPTKYELSNKVDDVAEGVTDKLDTNMIGKGSTEVIDDAPTLVKGTPSPKAGPLQMISGEDRIAKVAKHRAARQLQKEAAEKAFGGLGKLGKIAKAGGRLAKGGLKALPLVGPAIAGGLTAAMTGDVQAGLGEALDSEALGEGSDEVGDQDISRADLGIAERKGIEAQGEREEESEEDILEQLKFLKGGEEAPDQEEQLKGKRRKFNVLG